MNLGQLSITSTFNMGGGGKGAILSKGFSQSFSFMDKDIGYIIFFFSKEREFFSTTWPGRIFLNSNNITATEKTQGWEFSLDTLLSNLIEAQEVKEAEDNQKKS